MSAYNIKEKEHEYILIKRSTNNCLAEGTKMFINSYILRPLSPQEMHELKTELAGNKI